MLYFNEREILGRKEYILQEDLSYTLFNCKYEGWEEVERKELSKGHKNV